MNPVREKQRFSIRKLSIGAASVLLGFTFVTTQATTVHAADDSAQTKSELVSQAKQQETKSDASSTAKADSVLDSKTGTSVADASKKADQADAANVKDDSAKGAASEKAADAASTNEVNVKTAAASANASQLKQSAAVKTKDDTNGTDTKKAVSAANQEQKTAADDQTPAKVEDVDTTFNLKDFKLTRNANGDVVILDYDGDFYVDPNDKKMIVLPSTYDFIKQKIIVNWQPIKQGTKVYVTPWALSKLLRTTPEYDLSKDMPAETVQVSTSSDAGADNKLYLMGNNENKNDFAGTDVSEYRQNYESILTNTYATNVDLSGLDVSDLTDMTNLLSQSHHVKNINVSGWNTTNVTSMAGLFTQSVGDAFHGLEHIYGLNSWNTSNVESMNNMFSDNSSLKNVDVSSFDTSNVENMADMFAGCTALDQPLDVSNFNTSKVNDMSDMFRTVGAGDIIFSKKFDTSKVNNFNGMFGYSHVKSLDMSNFTISDNASTDNMFEGETPMIVIAKTKLDADHTGLSQRPLFEVKDGDKSVELPASATNHIFSSAKEAEDFVQSQLDKVQSDLTGKKASAGQHVDHFEPVNQYSGTQVYQTYEPVYVDNKIEWRPTGDSATTKTRTINITYPDGATQTVKQTVTFQNFIRYDTYIKKTVGNATLRFSTSTDNGSENAANLLLVLAAASNNSDWQDVDRGNPAWGEYTLIAIPNYVALQNGVPVKSVSASGVKSDTADQTINITYVPVHENSTDTKNVTRTITVVTPDGKQTVTTQTATFTRDVFINNETGARAYGDWHSDNPAFAAFAVPSVPGYVPSQASVEEHSVSASDVDNWTDPQIKITYSAIPLPVDPSNNNNNKPNNKPDDNKGDKPNDNKDNKPAKPVKPADPAKPAKPSTSKHSAKPNANRSTLLLKAAYAHRSAASSQATASAKASANAKAANTANQAKLPQTGSTSTVAVLALLATGLAAVIGLAGSRKHN